jgi:hypothetical protein
MKGKNWPTLLVLWTLLLSALAGSPVKAAGILYVKPDAGGNCSSWADACILQRALGSASSGDEIWVAEGTHKPGTNRTDTFHLKNGVEIYGGFAGTETSLDDRDWTIHETILSGDLLGDDGSGFANYADNSYHVVTGSGTDATAVLDGFTISGGYASGSYPGDRGGGMYNDQGSPTLTNVTFSGNTASSGGGMLNVSSSSPTLTNVTFSGNTASSGGGMHNGDNSNPVLTNVTFSGNTAMASGGGGMYNDSSSPGLTNVTFSGNLAIFGGGMYNWGSSPGLTNVTFSSNSAGYLGGGMYNCGDSSPMLTEVTFSGNTAANGGGGMYNESSSPTLTNVGFSGNSATNGSYSSPGGGMYNSSSSPVLTNVAFSGNTANYQGGGMYNDSKYMG